MNPGDQESILRLQRRGGEHTFAHAWPGRWRWCPEFVTEAGFGTQGWRVSTGPFAVLNVFSLYADLQYSAVKSVIQKQGEPTCIPADIMMQRYAKWLRFLFPISVPEVLHMQTR